MNPSTTNPQAWLRAPRAPVEDWCRRLAWCWAAILCLCILRAEEPIHVWPSLEDANGTWQLRIRFEMPERHYLYAERLSIAMSEAGRREEFILPAPTTQVELAGGKARLVYAHTFEAIRPLGGATPEPLTLLVHYQGCDGDNCFMPRARRWRLEPGNIPHELDAIDAPDEASPPEPWKTLATGFNVAAQGGGAPSDDEWKKFLRAIPDSAFDRVPAAPGQWRSRILLGASGAALALGIAFAWLGRSGRLAATLRSRHPASLAIIAAAAFAAGFLLERRSESAPRSGTSPNVALDVRNDPKTSRLLAQALEDARRSGQSIFVTFWTTQSDPASGASQPPLSKSVEAQLSKFVQLNLHIGDPMDSPARELCGFFSIRSLPAYLVLTSKAEPEPIPAPGAHCEPNHQVK